MLCRTITIPDAAQHSLQSLLGVDDAERFCVSVLIQNPTGNSAVFIGEKDFQKIEIAAASSLTIYPVSLKNLYIKGTTSDDINILVNQQ